MKAEKPILDKFYGKTKRFTKAVDQMKTVLRNIDKEAENMKVKKKEAELNKRISHIKQNPGNIILTRLKPIEIERLTNSSDGEYRWQMKLRNR